MKKINRKVQRFLKAFVRTFATKSQRHEAIKFLQLVPLRLSAFVVDYVEFSDSALRALGTRAVQKNQRHPESLRFWRSGVDEQIVPHPDDDRLGILRHLMERHPAHPIDNLGIVP